MGHGHGYIDIYIYSYMYMLYCCTLYCYIYICICVYVPALPYSVARTIYNVHKNKIVLYYIQLSTCIYKYINIYIFLCCPETILNPHTKRHSTFLCIAVMESTRIRKRTSTCRLWEQQSPRVSRHSPRSSVAHRNHHISPTAQQLPWTP